MLRAVRLKNFIKFEEDTFIPLSCPNNGAYFFVGENGSGKTSIFEAVRRCLNLESNTSFSTMPQKKPMYVICEYEFPDESLLGIYKSIISSIVYIPKKTEKDREAENLEETENPEVENLIEGATFEEAEKYGKVLVCVIEQTGKIDVFMDVVKIVKDDNDYKVANVQVKLDDAQENTLKEKLTTLIKGRDKSDEMDNYLQCVRGIITETTIETQEISNETDVEKRLIALSKCVVLTFMQRSIGRLQWSKSVLIKGVEKKKNYSQARKRCEIIIAFLKEKYPYNKAKEERFFKALTGINNYKFTVQNEDTPNEEITVELDQQPIEILKLPQGILEAKNLSLLLSSNDFKTVLLEEPDTGMHVRMIQIIRDIILPHIKEKVIIIISHSSAFINSRTIYRTVKVYREQGSKPTSGVIPLWKWNASIEKGGTTGKTTRLVANEKYSNILFAQIVFFVEGESDHLFITHLFSHLLDPDKGNSCIQMLTKAGILEADRAGVLEQLKDLIASLQVVSIDGEKNKEKWNDLSRRLKIKRIFLLDRDAVVETKIVSAPEFVYEKVEKNLFQMFKDANRKEDESTRDKLVKELDRNAWMNRDDRRPSDGCDLGSAYKAIEGRLLERLEKGQTSDYDPKEDEKAYLEYYFAVSRNLAIEPGHVITQLKAKSMNIVSSKTSKCFEQHINNNEWEKARDSLQNDGVFVWKVGALEDAFMELVVEEEANMTTKEKIVKMNERYKMFSCHNLQLDLKTFQKKRTTKLYMADNISEEDIQASIDIAFRFSSGKSDIMNLVTFLVRCARRKVNFSPWQEVA